MRVSIENSVACGFFVEFRHRPIEKARPCNLAAVGAGDAFHSDGTIAKDVFSVLGMSAAN